MLTSPRHPVFFQPSHPTFTRLDILISKVRYYLHAHTAASRFHSTTLQFNNPGSTKHPGRACPDYLSPTNPPLVMTIAASCL